MDEKIRVLYSGPKESLVGVRKTLGEAFEVLHTNPVTEELVALLAAADVFLDASMKVSLDSGVLEKAPKLKLVVTATTGADHIDAATLQKHNIPLLTLKGQKEVLNNLTPAAELSWLLVLACARRARAAINHVEQGSWDRVQFPGMMLKGKTLGVIGMGRIGSWMARYAHAFGMNVQAFDPFVKPPLDGVSLVTLKKVIETSDVITVHVNLTPESKGLLSSEVLKDVKMGAILVNTSRSDLVDESYIIELLSSGRLAAYGTDVLGGEPDILSNVLWQYAQEHENVIITPHIGGFSPEAVDVVLEFSAGRIKDFFEKKATT